MAVSSRYEVHATYPKDHKNPRLRGKTVKSQYAVGGIPPEEVTPELIAKLVHENNDFPGAEAVTVSEEPISSVAPLKSSLLSPAIKPSVTPKPSVGALPSTAPAANPASGAGNAPQSVPQGAGQPSAPSTGAEPANGPETPSAASDDTPDVVVGA